MKAILGTIHILRKHITGWVPWVHKMASFGDDQYFIYAEIVGGYKKVQNYANVIYGLSISHRITFSLPSSRVVEIRQIVLL